MVGVILNLAVWFALHTWFRQATRFRAGPLSFDAPLPAGVDCCALALSAAAAIAIFWVRAG